MSITHMPLQLVGDDGTIRGICPAPAVTAILSAGDGCLVTFGSGSAYTSLGHDKVRQVLSDCLTGGKGHPNDLPMVTFATALGKASIYLPAVQGLTLDEDYGTCVVVQEHGQVVIDGGIEDAFKAIQKREAELAELIARQARQRELAAPMGALSPELQASLARRIK